MVINEYSSDRSSLKPVSLDLSHVDHHSLQDGDARCLAKSAAALLRTDPEPLEWALEHLAEGNYIKKMKLLPRN